MNKKFLSGFLNYAPGLIILIFGMIALHSSLLLISAQEDLSLDPARIPSIIDIVKIPEKRLYWSIIALGLSGFVLILLNADKVRKLSVSQKERQKAQSEKEQIQKQFYQAQKMEAIGRLAGGIAHDFNNILAAINGYAEFLIADLDQKSQEHKFAENILKAGLQGRSLVDQMLAFSRIKGSAFEPLDFVQPLQEAISLLRASLPKSIDLIVQINADQAPVFGNPTQISQAIMNLCVNAKDAMADDKGCLKVALDLVQSNEYRHLPMIKEKMPEADEAPFIAIEDGGNGYLRLMSGCLVQNTNYVCLSIEDSGSGMERSVLEHVFEPFFTTKAVDKGTGLGLSTVHGVLISHLGAIIVDTTLGQGTRFQLFFPKLSSISSRHDVEDVKAGDVAHAQILVVEDQPEVAEVTMIMLRRIGFKAKWCASGEAALEELHRHPRHYDLVLTDQNMPKMTGMDLLNEAYKDFPHLPFVMLSGYSEKNMQAMIADHPAVKAMIAKPVQQEKLRQILSSVLSQNDA